MASNSLKISAIFTVISASLLFVFATPSLGAGSTLTYHGGPLLKGNLKLTLIWYGQFNASQMSIVRGFISSLNYNGGAKLQPQVSTWWNFVGTFHDFAKQKRGPTRVKVVKQIVDPTYSIGHVVTVDFLQPLVDKAGGVDPDSILVFFTAHDVTVQGLCLGRCSEHGVLGKQPYILVGNPEDLCPEACGVPFYKAKGAPVGITVKPPNGNLGGDAMAIALAQGLVEVVTNPFQTGFFQDMSRKGIEAATACQGVFGSGAAEGAPGKMLVDATTGGGFNAHGSRDRKFLVPAIWNPNTNACWTVM